MYFTKPEVAVPAELSFDEWTGSYRDHYNNVWVSKPFERKQWVAAFRDRGNVSTVISRHRDLARALDAAAEFIRGGSNAR